MARHGDGTKYFDEKKQLWRAMVTTPGGKRATKSSRSEEVVEDWLNEQRLLIGRGKHIEPHGFTLAQWATEWMEVYAKPSVRPKTFDGYKSMMNVIINGKFVPHGQEFCFEGLGDIKLRSLSPSHIQRFLNSVAANYAPSTVSHFRFCLSGCLEQAVINNLIYTNPASVAKTPSALKPEIEIFEPHEVTAMLEASKQFRNPLVILLAYTTGMRLSEILALRWEDCDTQDNTVSVNQTIHRSLSAGVKLEAPKTRASKRKIPIPEEVAKAIIEHKLQNGITTGLLFLSKTGTPMEPHNYTKRTYYQIRAAAGLKKGIHAFRHTHATELLTSGVPVHEVSRRLGHSRVSTTLDVYSHVMPSSDQRIADQVSALLHKKRPV